MNEASFPIHAVFNQFEACAWMLLAIALAVRRPVKEHWRWSLPLTFMMFGISDLVEVHLGPGRVPWWLLAIKACCVAVFLLAWRVYLRQTTRHE